MTYLISFSLCFWFFLFRLKLTQSLLTKRERRLNFYPMSLLLHHSLRFSNSFRLIHLNLLVYLTSLKLSHANFQNHCKTYKRGFLYILVLFLGSFLFRMIRRQGKALYRNTRRLSAKEPSKETNHWWNQSALRSSNIDDHLHFFVLALILICLVYPVLLWEKPRRSLGKTHQAAMRKKMRQIGTKRVLQLSVPPGYREVTPSMSLFLLKNVHILEFHLVNNLVGVVDYGKTTIYE